MLLRFPFSIILAPLVGFVSSAAAFYKSACLALFLQGTSIPAVLSMLVFVVWTPYVGKAVFYIICMLLLKFVEFRVGESGRVDA